MNFNLNEKISIALLGPEIPSVKTIVESLPAEQQDLTKFEGNMLVLQPRDGREAVLERLEAALKPGMLRRHVMGIRTRLEAAKREPTKRW